MKENNKTIKINKVEDEMQIRKPELKYNSRGESGNIFHIMAHAGVLISEPEAAKMRIKVIKDACNYKDALDIINEYVHLVDEDKEIQNDKY